MKQVALLTDRIRFNEDGPQLYGPVLDWDESGKLGCDLENPDSVDELRETVGLPPFEQSLLDHRRDVEAEGGKPPSNYQAYKKEVADWAKRVGWV